MTDAVSRSQLVAVGCSAGGIEALTTLLATLRTPFPAPIVIAQHLDPRRTSHLAEVLQRRSTLPVRTVTGRVALEPGIVYVVPSGTNVGVTDHDIELLPVGDERPRPSVDVLLRTAADVYGDNLIAVILTGSGSDGSAGALHVKRCGGTVVIQNPDTASFPGMPESLSPTAVDIVADLDRIGPLLYDLLTGVYVDPQPDEEKQLRALLETVRDRSGIDFKKYKQATILRRLRRRIVATDSETTQGYIRYLEAHPEECQRLVNSFLIKVTEFMRDPELFRYLRETILPELIARTRHEGRPLRIWSAGCATGEEAYSLAMLVAEIVGDELETFNVRIFSTDVDGEAIAFARRGMYPASAVEDLPRDLVDRHFVQVGGNYQVKKRIRTMTVFGEHDLGQRAPFPHVDLVVCRNVLIYFTSELQRRTLQLFAFSLREEGYLVLGKAETTSPLGDFFVPHEVHHKIYLRHGGRMLIPPARVGPSVPPRRSARGRVAPPSVGPRAPRDVVRPRVPLEIVLASMPFGAVLIDGRYDVLEINFAARRLLGIHGPAVGEDFVHLAQIVGHRALLDAIDAALRGEVPAPIQVRLEAASGGESRHLEVACFPQHPDAAAQRPGAVLVVVTDVTTTTERQHALEAAVATAARAQAALAKRMTEGETERARLATEGARLRDQSAELTSALTSATTSQRADQAALEKLTETNQRLLRANEDLTAAHETLRGANEELMLSSEEAQAATEEVETLNEEFQATNEELETVNEELQSTIEELNTTNADLEARSREIQELSAPIEAERGRLAAILHSLGDALLVVDRDGRPLLTNDTYDRTFGAARGALADDAGRPIREGETPEQRVARGERFRAEFTATDPGGVLRHFEATGQPIPGASPGAIDGGVLVIRDITDRSVRQLQDRFLAMASHELRTPMVPLRGYLDMLVKLLDGEGGADVRLRRFASQARSQSERLERLVNDLVNATRIQTGKFQLQLAPTPLGPLVAHVAELAQMMAATPAIRLADLPAEPLVVRGDAARLEQVLLNLLGNAQRYASGSSAIDLRLRRAGSSAEIEVQDYGPGIAEADLPHVFTSFYQGEHGRSTRGDGMGLGLYICNEILRAHGGQLSVRSATGQGTTFVARLSLSEPS